MKVGCNHFSVSHYICLLSLWSFNPQWTVVMLPYANPILATISVIPWAYGLMEVDRHINKKWNTKPRYKYESDSKEAQEGMLNPMG